MKSIKFFIPDITQLEIDEVVDTLKSGWITTGAKTKLFERNVAEYVGLPRAVGLNSATAGLFLVLKFLGIKEGDEVITTAYTYSASASVITHAGARPVLVDVAKDSYEMDYEQLASKITPKTKAIIPVDFGGVVCDYAAINRVLEEKKHLYSPSNDRQRLFDRVVTIADAAHSLGSVRDGKNSGQFANFSVFSLHAVKNLTTAEGGMLVWNSIEGMTDEEIYNEFMLLSLHGQSKDALAKNALGAWEYDIKLTGYKFNLTDIASSIGLAQLKRYNSTLQRRREIIELYDSLLAGKLVSLKHFGQGFASCGHLYCVRVLGANEQRRNNIITALAQKGIGANVHYKPLPMLTAYKNLGFDISNFKNSFAQYQNEISLPLHNLLSNDDVKYVSDTLIDELKK